MSEDYNRNAGILRLVQVIYFLTGALNILLLLRVVLRLLRANPANEFARFIYNLSHSFVVPFANLFRRPVFEKSEVLDINALVAILVYALLAWLVTRFIWLVFSRMR